MTDLFDVEYGHLVGGFDSRRVWSRWGDKYRLEGDAIIGPDDEVWGSITEGKLYNRSGYVMAESRSS